MKATILILAIAAAASAARATTIATLYDTGVTGTAPGTTPLVLPNQNGAGNGVLDSHFTTLPGTAAYTFDIFPPYYSETLANPARWISTATNANGVVTFANATGVYDYTEMFSLIGFSSAVISGSWASDDCAEIFVNGFSTGQTIGGGTGVGGSGSNCTAVSSNFTTTHNFTIDSGTFAHFNFAGSNTLDFQVYNASGPTALLVYGLQANASAVPEPSSVLLTLTGFVLLGIAIRRRWAGNRTCP